MGLAVTAPPSCVCLPSDHAGALLHPIFPHAHASTHDVWESGSGFNLASHDPASYDAAPSISGAPSSGTALDVLGGMMFPMILTALLMGGSLRRPRTEAHPGERTVLPPTPPPRLFPAIV